MQIKTITVHYAFNALTPASFPHTPNFAPHDLHLHCVVTIVDAGIRRPSVSFGGVRGGCRYGGIDSVLIWLVTTSTAPAPLADIMRVVLEDPLHGGVRARATSNGSNGSTPQQRPLGMEPCWSSMLTCAQ